jgi:hypothetical protein
MYKFLVLRVFILVAMFSITRLNAQNVPQIIPPAPNAAALAQYVDIPVSKYTGVPSISVPIYTINTGGYELPISVSYHASGIKAQQEASSVGLGWALNAGGVITRQVRGIEDFISTGDKRGFLKAPSLPAFGNYDGISSLISKYICGGFMPGTVPANVLDPFVTFSCDGGGTSPDGLRVEAGYLQAYYKADTESDLYSFNFGSYSGKFVVNKDGSTVLFSPESGIIIKVINSNSWQATTTDGVIYKFEKKEYTQPYSFSQDEYNDGFTYLTGGNSDLEYISSWYLSEILLTNGENITFSYIDLNTDSWSYGPVTVSRAETVNNHYQCSSSSEDTKRYTSYNRKYSKSSSKNTVECYLHTISWNEGTVNMSYSDRDDIDTQGSIASQKLDEISIKKLDGTMLFNIDGTEISNVKFNYSYFNSQDSNDYFNFLSLRLKLDWLTIDNKKYSFSYLNPNALPKKYSNSIDHWGYFNNEPNLSDITQNDVHGNPYKVPYFIPEMLVVDPTYFPQPKFYEGAKRDCNPAVLTNGMLTSIQYPTKGLVSFEYEPNDFEVTINAITTSFGLLKREDAYDDKTFSAYNYATASDNCTGCYPPDTPNTPFTLTKATTVSMEFKYTPYGLPIMPAGTFGLVTRIDGGGTFSKSFNFDPSWSGKIIKEDVLLEAGTYMIVATPQQNYNTSGIVRYSVEKALPASKKMTGGGLRIKKIISDKNTREFFYTKENDLTKTSGLLLIEPDYGHIDYKLFECIFALVRESSPIQAISDSGSTVGYSYVKESITDGVDISSTVSNYRNRVEFRSRGSNIPIMPAFDNGLLFEESYLNNSRPVLKKSYNYVNGLIKRYELYDTYFLRLYFAFGNYIDSNYYRIMPEWWKLTSETTENYFYDTAGIKSTVSSQIDYEYNINNFKTNKTTTKDSKGLDVIQKITYPVDYTSYNYTSMVSRNITTVPIETITLVDGKVTQAKLNTFKPVQVWPDGEVQLRDVPEAVYSFNKVNSPTESAFVKYNGVTPSSTYYKKDFQYDFYNLRGEPLQITEGGVKVHSYLWGYNQNYPVAQIENATYAQLTALPEFGTGYSISTSLSAGQETSLRTNLSSAMVTTYTYKPLIGVSSITDPKGLITYYEYDSFNRLQYIKDKDLNVLQKYCYNYLGQLTDCSAGTGTVTTYKNIFKSLPFTKQPCTGGVGGTKHVYSVPAGIYSSTISQADADAQASAEIAANGQNFADANGSCLTVPGVPTGLVFTSATATTLNFSWTAVAGATGYTIYKAGAPVSTVTTTSGSLSGLIASTAYNVQVLAINSSVEGALCTSVSMSTLPGAPTGLALTSATATTLNFSWTAVAGATSYRIYKAGALVGTVSTATGTLSGLTASTAYNVQVLAINSSGDGALSSSVSMSTTALPMGFYMTSGTYPTTPGSTLNGTIKNTLAAPIYVYALLQIGTAPWGSSGGSGSATINGVTITASGAFIQNSPPPRSSSYLTIGSGATLTITGSYGGTTGSNLILAYSLSPGGTLTYFSTF